MLDTIWNRFHHSILSLQISINSSNILCFFWGKELLGNNSANNHNNDEYFFSFLGWLHVESHERKAFVSSPLCCDYYLKLLYHFCVIKYWRGKDICCFQEKSVSFTVGAFLISCIISLIFTSLNVGCLLGYWAVYKKISSIQFLFLQIHSCQKMMLWNLNMWLIFWSHLSYSVQQVVVSYWVPIMWFLISKFKMWFFTFVGIFVLPSYLDVCTLETFNFSCVMFSKS